MTDGKKYLIGIDIGTTSLKAAIFGTDGVTVSAATVDYTLDARGNMTEFDADEYISIVRRGLTEAAEKAFPGESPSELCGKIAGISVDTQGETLIVTDEQCKPLRPAIVWLDNRATAEAEELEHRFGRQTVYEITGQPEITATWPACKLLWIKRNEPEIWARTKRVFLLEDWILRALTGEFVTEPTVQSSTIYFDISRKCWWDGMLGYIGVTAEMLPRVVPSGTPVGRACAQWLSGGGAAGEGCSDGIPVMSGALDQIAGAIGAGVVGNGIVSEMTGTTMTVFAPCGGIPEYDPKSIVPCHLSYDGSYALLSWTPTAGIALKWFKNKLCEGYSFAGLDSLAEKLPYGSDGLVFLPYLCGSTMPKYDPEARGAFFGLTMEHTRGHMVRAILESVACMLRGNLEYLGVRCSEIRTMGGGALSPLWCRIKADITGMKLVTLKNTETACLGAAILAGVGVGIYASVEAACAELVVPDKVYEPHPTEQSDAAYRAYCETDDRLYPRV